MLSIAEILSQELGQKLTYVQNVIDLMDEGNTIPFIARYRKEMHGAMDDTVLRTLETRLTYLRNLQARRDEVKNSIENQGKLTEELATAIDNAATLAEVEDLYRPYKQKRRTRASIAREKGLEPWRRPFLPRMGRTLPNWQRPTLTPKRALRLWKTPLPAHLTSLRRIFPTMRQSARTSATL